MDIGTFHSIWTVILFICILGVVWWAYGKRRQSRFDEAANSIFDDEKSPEKEDQGVTKK